jgi:hypothetical protein
MNSYVITGAKRTGGDVQMDLEAATEADARAAAIQDGVMITECKMISEENPVGKITEVYLREIVTWLRFFGVATAIVLFAVILKIVMK